MNVIEDLIDEFGCFQHKHSEAEADVSLLKVLEPFVIPDELLSLINRCNANDIGHYRLSRLSDGINLWLNCVKIDHFSWPKSWFELASDDVLSILAVLPRSKEDQINFLSFDMGGGDSEAYLLFENLKSFLEYSLEWEQLHMKGVDCDQDTLLLKHSPNAFVYGQKGHFSTNRVRNVFDLFDPETVPDEWL